MQNTIASDLNNPDFVGAQDPDATMHVEFFWHEPIDKWGSEVASQEQQRRVVRKLPKQVFVRIMRPGDQLSILEVPLREEHKYRWPKQWSYFELSEGLRDDGANIPGFKLDEWDELKEQPELLRDLKYMRFYTVEQIAGASDGQIQKMGIGGPGLREKAKAALRSKLSAQINEQIAAKDAEVAAVKKQNEELAAQMREMQESLKVLTAAKAEEPAKRGPGRPRANG
jgi:hypothetical protein